MKAMILQSYGDGYDFIQQEIPRPEPGPGEVLIKVAGTSFNPIDNKIATLGDQLGFAPKLPAVLGMDVSGVVESVGEGVDVFKPGDAVYGCAGGLGDMQGALAEYMVADVDLLAHAPRNMELADAAALPLVSITAWLGLFGKADLCEGETLLVHGGAGGVGHMAVQLGIAAGAEVYATVSSETKATIVEALGATPINYHEKDVETYVSELTDGEGFDVIYDTIGGPHLETSFQAAVLDGAVVTTVSRSTIDLSLMHSKALSLHVVFMLLPLITGQERVMFTEILAQLAELVENDTVAVLLDEARFKMTEIAEAHRYWASGEAMGKIVIDAEW